jgi:hypothetical protein
MGLLLSGAQDHDGQKVSRIDRNCHQHGQRRIPP